MLELEAISKVYKIGTFGGVELQAVSDVSFSVGDREVVALIGESGSGKSTIGKMILRLLKTNSGRITFNDVDIAGLRGRALKDYYRKVQGVFQDPFSSYNPVFKADRLFTTIHDEFFPAVGDGEWKDKVDSALRGVGLNPPDVLDKFAHQLSGGQLQRFLIARALLLDIEFLVADEIISMLDASTRIDVLNLLADLKSRGLSILFITHDLSLGYYISERSVILYRGCVAEMGSTERIFENPLHPYTKMLMDSVARLDQKWTEDGGQVEVMGPQSPLGEGCVYYGRCPVAIERCASYRPPLQQVESDHSVACVHYTSE